MKLDIKEVLEKILLPVQDGWKLDRIDLDESNLEVQVYLNYDLKNWFYWFSTEKPVEP